MLFLHPDPATPDGYRAESWTGMYRIVDGVVQPVSRAAVPVSDEPEQTFIERIRRLAAP